MNPQHQSIALYGMGGRDVLVDVLAGVRSTGPAKDASREWSAGFQEGLNAAADIIHKEIELRRKPLGGGNDPTAKCPGEAL